jgi:hypothetical protein
MVDVTQAANALTVKLTDWLIMHDVLDEEGPGLQRTEAFGDFCDDLLQAALQAENEALKARLAVLEDALRRAISDILTLHQCRGAAIRGAGKDPEMVKATERVFNNVFDRLPERRQALTGDA